MPVQVHLDNQPSAAVAEAGAPDAPEPTTAGAPKPVVLPLDDKAMRDLGAIGAVRDEKGRIIALRRMAYSRKMAVSSLIGSDDTTNPVFFTNALTACNVAGINGELVPFPTTRLQLDALWDRLDDHGIRAVNHYLQTQAQADEANAKN